MASADDLNIKADAILEAASAERAENQAIYLDLREQIRVLQEAGAPDLDPVAAKLDEALVRIGAISEPQ